MAKPAPNPLSAQHRAAFKRYAQSWQRRLGMSDWRIVLSRKRSAEMADVTYHLPDRLAVLAIGRDFGSVKVTPESLEEIALHEMLHVFFAVVLDPALPDDARAGAEHSVINVLTKLLLSKDTE